MRVKFGQQEFTFPGSQLGELRDSSELVGNPPALRERMAEEGYLFLRGLLDRDKVLTARERVLAYMHQQQALAPGQPVLEGVMPKGSRNPQILGRRGVSHHPDVRAVLEAPKLFEFWREYYGEPVGTFDYKWLRAVGNEEFTGCHYDIVYMGRGSRRLHTCWIPMGDLPVEQGTLAVCIGSHNLPCFERLRQTYGNMDVDRDLTEGLFTSNPQEITERFGGQWATTNFRAGDVLAFGLYTMHASTTNITNHARLDNQHHQPCTPRQPTSPTAGESVATFAISLLRTRWTSDGLAKPLLPITPPMPRARPCARWPKRGQRGGFEFRHRAVRWPAVWHSCCTTSKFQQVNLL